MKRSHLSIVLMKSYLENLRAYKADFVISLAAVPIEFAFVVAFWGTIYGSFTQLTNIPGFQVTISYYAFLLVYNKAISSLKLSEKLANDIFSGNLDTILSKPVNPVVIHAIEAYVRYLVFVPLYLCVYLLIIPIYGLRPSFSSIVVASTILLFSSYIAFVVSYLIGLVGVWTTRIAGLLRIYGFIELILSGGFVPLYLYPDFLKSMISVLPFQYIIYIPVIAWVAPERIDMLTFVLLVFWVAMLSIALYFISKKAFAAYQSSYG